MTHQIAEMLDRVQHDICPRCGYDITYTLRDTTADCDDCGWYAYTDQEEEEQVRRSYE